MSLSTSSINNSKFDSKQDKFSKLSEKFSQINVP